VLPAVELPEEQIHAHGDARRRPVGAGEELLAHSRAVDLDLDLEEELEEVDALAEEPMSEPPGAPAIEPEPAVEPEPTADADLLERDPVEEEQAVDLAEEESDPEPAGADQAADDVLEETPEFLRDNPDDDELWFEQGEPKDFDFK